MIMHLLFADSAAQIVSHRVATSWAWYVVRAAGIVAAGLLILLVISGIGLVTGYTYRLFEPIQAWVIHRALGLALLASVVVHVLFILFDKIVPFSILNVILPFNSGYKPVRLFGIALGSLWIALGILALYGIIIIIASSLGWIERRKKTWRLLHYLSYFVAFAVFLHALYLGTDLAHGIFRLLWLIVGVILVIGVVMRLYRAGTIKHT